jgi:hypothetical protein
MTTGKKSYLKAGDWVEVRSRAEILRTLDQHGRLEHLPFMPEMFQYCGRKLQVFKRVDKTCDNIEPWSIRRMKNAVHLRDVRCDGSGHDGCQAGCLIFWKEAWLKPAQPEVASVSSLQREAATPSGGLCTVESILSAAKKVAESGDAAYICQATEVIRFTYVMRSWSPAQYVRDIRSGNLSTGLTRGAARSCGWLEIVLSFISALRQLAISLFNVVQVRRGVRYPPDLRAPQVQTPLEILDLQPGELVEVRSREEIEATLDQASKNRGLYFGPEMLFYSGGIYRVFRRVHRIVDEKTGGMVHMKQPCIILENVWCRADFHRFCPRAIYHYWRESWLKRVEVSKPSMVSPEASTRFTEASSGPAPASQHRSVLVTQDMQ